MHLLESEWLIRMLQKAGNTPQKRMLSLFTILDDWIEAPQVTSTPLHNQTIHAPNLIKYLTQEAVKAKAQAPEILANQLYFMAIAAQKEKSQNIHSFTSAYNAADALIEAQTKNNIHIPKKAFYATAASLIILFVCGSLFLSNNLVVKQNSNLASIGNINLHKPVTTVKNTTLVASASPSQTAALFAQIEQMRHGECQLIEAIQLPDAYKSIYFENIVLGHISSNLQEQIIVKQLLEKVRCNYTPILMINSKN